MIARFLLAMLAVLPACGSLDYTTAPPKDMPGTSGSTQEAVKQTTVTSIAELRALDVTIFAPGDKVLVDGYYGAGTAGGGIFQYDANSAAINNDGTIIQPTNGGGRWLRIYTGDISVAWFGAKGDGATNDTANLNQATAFAASLGRATVTFEAGKTYVIRRQRSHSQQGGILVSAGVSLDGHGCTLLLQDNASFIQGHPNLAAAATISADVAAGALTLTVDSTAKLAVGDTVGVKLGNNSYDPAETCLAYLAVIKSIGSPTSVTLDTPAALPMTIGSTVANNRILIDFSESNPIYQNCFIRNFRLIQGGTGNAEEGIQLWWSRNIKIENIYAENPGAGAVNFEYAFNNTVQGITVVKSAKQNGQASKGRVISMNNSDCCVFRAIRAEQCQGDVVFVEGYSRNIKIDDLDFVDNWTEINNGARTRVAFYTGQNSQAHYNNIRISGDGTGLVFLDSGGTPADASYSNVMIKTRNQIKALDLALWKHGRLEINGYWADHSSIKRETIPIRVESNWKAHTPSLSPPNGLTLGIWHSTNNKADLKTWSITGAAALRFMPGMTTSKTLVANSGRIGTDYPSNAVGKRTFVLNSGTVAAETLVTMEFRYIPYQQLHQTSEPAISPTSAKP